MKVGDKLVILSYEWKDGAYKDQFDIPHRGIVVREAVEIEVFETKKVKGDYSPEKEFDGFRARAADGRVFESNWGSFDEVSSSPYQNWTFPGCEKNYDIYLWHEMTMMMRYRTLVTDDGEKFTHPSMICCAEHKIWHYRAEECYMCKYGKGKINGETRPE